MRVVVARPPQIQDLRPRVRGVVGVQERLGGLDGNAGFRTCFRGNSLPRSGSAVTWPEYVEKPTIAARAGAAAQPMFHCARVRSRLCENQPVSRARASSWDAPRQFDLCVAVARPSPTWLLWARTATRGGARRNNSRSCRSFSTPFAMCWSRTDHVTSGSVSRFA